MEQAWTNRMTAGPFLMTRNLLNSCGSKVAIISSWTSSLPSLFFPFFSFLSLLFSSYFFEAILPDVPIFVKLEKSGRNFNLH